MINAEECPCRPAPTISSHEHEWAAFAGRDLPEADTDRGFATFAGMTQVDPDIAWAKLAALSDGARLASERLWG